MKTFSPKEDVYTLLFDAPTGSAALGAAIKTGAFWMLAERPMDADAICQTLTIPGKGGRLRARDCSFVRLARCM